MLYGMTIPDIESCQAAPADAGPAPDSGSDDAGSTTDAGDAG
jgi:hypothetical protein